MNDAGLLYAINRLLRSPTKEDAEKGRDNIGADYVEIYDRLLARMTFKRSNDQNALLHMWFGEIAKQAHMTAAEVKGLCHLEFGLPIRLRDKGFAWVWNNSGGKLNYEQKCKLLASGVLNLSSGMTTKELTEYLDAIESHYRAQGYSLTQPREIE